MRGVHFHTSEPKFLCKTGAVGKFGGQRVYLVQR